MTDIRLSRLVRTVTAAFAGASMLAGSAFADDSSTQIGARPGVTGDYRIAKPAP